MNTILSRCFKKKCPNLVDNFQDFRLPISGGEFVIDFIVTKVVSGGRKSVLAPRCFQSYLNHRPVYVPKKLRNVAIELYRDFTVDPSSFPYFLIHI